VVVEDPFKDQKCFAFLKKKKGEPTKKNPGWASAAQLRGKIEAQSSGKSLKGQK